jgi:hypothetical protein
VIIDRDAASVPTRLNRFTDGLCHLSLDAATVHGNAVLDIILLRTDPNEPSADYFLFHSNSVIESTFEFYSSTVAMAIEKPTHDRIQIRLIVGDGFSSQIAALSPDKDSAIQNSPEYIERCPAIFYVYCNCHLVNLALVDAFDQFSFFSQCNRTVMSLAHVLRRRENWRALKSRCPTGSPTCWCHSYLLCR